MRVGVSQGSTSQGVLTRELKQASVVAVPSLKAAGEMLGQGKLDAFATNKAILFEMGDGLPGAKVLAGRWGLEHFAFGIPKGREQAMPYLARFVDAADAGWRRYPRGRPSRVARHGGGSDLALDRGKDVVGNVDSLALASSRVVVVARVETPAPAPAPGSPSPPGRRFPPA
jgi:hypothetical protein